MLTTCYAFKGTFCMVNWLMLILKGLKDSEYELDNL